MGVSDPTPWFRRLIRVLSHLERGDIDRDKCGWTSQSLRTELGITPESPTQLSVKALAGEWRVEWPKVAWGTHLSGHGGCAGEGLAPRKPPGSDEGALSNLWSLTIFPSLWPHRSGSLISGPLDLFQGPVCSTPFLTSQEPHWLPQAAHGLGLLCPLSIYS